MLKFIVMKFFKDLAYSPKQKHYIVASYSTPMTMPIDIYRFWFNALKEDDVEEVVQTLSSATVEEKNKLLNGVFDFMENDLNVPFIIGAGVCKPLSVCTIYNSFKVLPSLLEHGLLIEEKDNTGDNILHLLVKRAVFRPAEEDQVINAYK